MHRVTVEVRVGKGETSRWERQSDRLRGGRVAGAFAWNREITEARKEPQASYRVTLWRQKADGDWKTVETWEQTGRAEGEAEA